MPDPHKLDPDGGDANTSADADFEIWRIYDAGGPVVRLQVRCRDDVAVPNWRHGRDLFTELQHAEAQGWAMYDREPGDAPGEHAIFHMKRDARTGHSSR